MDNSFMEPFYKQRYEDMVDEGLREQETRLFSPRQHDSPQLKHIIFLTIIFITLACLWLAG